MSFIHELLLMYLISIFPTPQSGTIQITMGETHGQLVTECHSIKGLNIWLVYWLHYSTPSGLPEGFLTFFRGFHPRLFWLNHYVVRTYIQQKKSTIVSFGIPRGTRGQNRPIISFYDILKPSLIWAMRGVDFLR